ncbi:hypothetical protein JOC58_001888 [Paenibacillus hunanensis]|uniref:Uncharacterized protein n=1 Tax=Paenibacillus hunanensis TaxID=539262 RepID=A0ABU1IYC7_9BACL|nr:hypothetical protein [Paenibacillus hunanensis]
MERIIIHPLHSFIHTTQFKMLLKTFDLLYQVRLDLLTYP